MKRRLPYFWSREFHKLTVNARTASTGFRFHPRDFASFAVSDLVLQVPHQATFGGWIKRNGAPSEPETAIRATKSLIDLTGVGACRITLPPAYFADGGFEPQRIALSAFAEKEIVETNHHIPLESSIAPLAMNRGNKKRIRAFLEQGGVVVPVEENRIKMAYELLLENRQRRGVNLSMTFDRFLQGLTLDPETFHLFEARDSREMLAAAYVVQIHPDVAYVLFWGDSIAGRRISAVASLAAYLITHYRIAGKKVLDLGVSSVDGKVDEGLSRFKVNLGATSSPKSTLLISAASLLGSKGKKLRVTID